MIMNQAQGKRLMDLFMKHASPIQKAKAVFWRMLSTNNKPYHLMLWTLDNNTKYKVTLIIESMYRVKGTHAIPVLIPKNSPIYEMTLEELRKEYHLGHMIKYDNSQNYKTFAGKKDSQTD